MYRLQKLEQTRGAADRSLNYEIERNRILEAKVKDMLSVICSKLKLQCSGYIRQISLNIYCAYFTFVAGEVVIMSLIHFISHKLLGCIRSCRFLTWNRKRQWIGVAWSSSCGNVTIFKLPFMRSVPGMSTMMRRCA